MMPAAEILVFQHVACEHPGVFRDFAAADGHRLTAVELDAGETIPPLECFDALWVMGGPMDVWQEDAFPWLRAEKAAIRRAVSDLDLPFLGFCLGHQLLAEALGGQVAASAVREIGVMPVDLTLAGRAHSCFSGFPDRFDVLQWHSSEVARPPAGASVLASSADCAVQAMQVGRRALSVQFHLEITATTVTDWAELPGYQQALAEVFGNEGPAKLAADAAAGMKEFNAGARRLYRHWSALTGLARRRSAAPR